MLKDHLFSTRILGEAF